MILVTGGTGFIGRALIRHLVENGHPVRTLIRPSPHSPNLPRGVPMEVVVSGLTDERSLRAAMVGVDTVYHLAGGEWTGPRANLLKIDIEGTKYISQAAADAGVKRIFFLSHLAAARASAYPVLNVKGIAEEYIRRCGVDYTILRSAIVYGPNDKFTSGLARILQAFPFLFFTPGDGKVLLQPIWVEDLVTCLAWALEDPETCNHTYEIGGPEYLSFNQIAGLVMNEIGIRRRLTPLRPTTLRGLTVLLESIFPGLPISVFWLDYVAVNRTCALDTAPRVFNLMPARMSQRLAYLRGQHWGASLLRSLMQRQV